MTHTTGTSTTWQRTATARTLWFADDWNLHDTQNRCIDHRVHVQAGSLDGPQDSLDHGKNPLRNDRDDDDLKHMHDMHDGGIDNLNTSNWRISMVRRTVWTM